MGSYGNGSCSFGQTRGRYFLPAKRLPAYGEDLAPSGYLINNISGTVINKNTNAINFINISKVFTFNLYHPKPKDVFIFLRIISFQQKYNLNKTC